MKTMIEIEKFSPFICKGAIEYRKQFETFEEAWENCLRGDWMLWIAKKLNVNKKTLTKAKALCALTVRHLMKDERSIKACEVALKFSEGLATLDELNDAHKNANNDDVVIFKRHVMPRVAAYAAKAAAAAALYCDATTFDRDAYDVIDYAALAEGDSREKTADICRVVLAEEVFKNIKNL